MIAVFGTMAADILHGVLGVPLAVSTVAIPSPRSVIHLRARYCRRPVAAVTLLSTIVLLAVVVVRRLDIAHLAVETQAAPSVP